MSLSVRIEQVAEIDSTNEACRRRALAAYMGRSDVGIDWTSRIR